MGFHSRWGVVLGLWLALGQGPAWAAPTTLCDCLAEAVQHSTRLAASAEAVEESRAERDALRGHLLPVLTLDSTLLRWDAGHDLKVDVSALGTLLTPFQALLKDDAKAVLAQLMQDGIQLEVHAPFTAETTVALAQPVTQLYRVTAGLKARDALVDAALDDGVIARRKVEDEVIHAWYGLVTATTLQGTIDAGLRQVDAIEQKVQALLAADMVERNALLKVQVRRAELVKKRFRATKGVKLATAVLNLHRGRPLDEPLEPVLDDDLSRGPDAPVEPPSDVVAMLAAPLESQQDRAIDARPELKAGRSRQRALDYARHVAIGETLPDITVLGAWQNRRGFGALYPENAWFAGVMIEWKVWEWGARYYEVKAVEARRRRVQAELKDGEEHVRLDVQARRLALEEAVEQERVVATQVAQAREALAVEDARFQAQEAAVSDLLAAQTAAQKAENDATIARGRVLEARALLRSGMGEDPLAEVTP